jgi:uncharacterized damage-inducible protein DinB
MDYARHHFAYLARYNRTANEQLLTHLAALPVDEIGKPRSSYYGSIQGLLGHVVSADMNWLRRLREQFSSDEPLQRSILMPPGKTGTPYAFPQFDEYRHDRALLDAIFVDWVALADTARFGEILAYMDLRGHPRRFYVSDVLDHVFNHQTHHRGQVSQLLDEMGVVHDFSNLISAAEIPAES